MASLALTAVFEKFTSTYFSPVVCPRVRYYGRSAKKFRMRARRRRAGGPARLAARAGAAARRPRAGARFEQHFYWFRCRSSALNKVLPSCSMAGNEWLLSH